MMAAPMFTLIQTVAFDVEIGDVDSFTLRVELFQDQSDVRRFRAALWRTEFFNIQSTFPRHESTGEPIDSPSDEKILVDWSHNLSATLADFRADNADAALKAVLEDYERWLRHTLG